MQQNMKPSAPPQEECQHEYFDDFVQPNDLPIPDAIQQQIIYQQIQAANRAKQKQNKAIEPEGEEKQPPAKLNHRPSSYLSQTLQHPHTTSYQSAAMCVWRPKRHGKGIQFMMCVDQTTKKLSFFRANRVSSDINCADTALRAFHDQTANKLDNDILSQIRSMLARDADRCVFWKAEWNAVLFYYQMSYDYHLVKDYSKNKAPNASIHSLHWLDFHKLHRAVFITGDPIKIAKQTYPLDSFTTAMLLHEQNKAYLQNLFVKHGGSVQQLQPHKGGNIRQPARAFHHLPSAIRLDILHPITHSTLYHRWIDMDICAMEDYQLLMSLISSICPETTGNFALFHTDNTPFATATNVRRLDTMPKFKRVQELLSHQQSNGRIVHIAVLPTIVLATSFKGIPLAFKPSEVSWNPAVEQYDDEKTFQYAGDSAKVSAPHLFGYGTMKWQFLDSSNQFVDYDYADNIAIEKAFVQGQGFAIFHRQGTPYQANFSTMYQKNLQTSSIRNIRRVPGSVAAGGAVRTVDYHKWQYQEDDGSWVDFETTLSKQLNGLKQSIANNAYYACPVWGKRVTLHTRILSSSSGVAYDYQIDYLHCRQRNMSTKKERAVQQVPVYVYKAKKGCCKQRNDGKCRWEWQDDDGTFKAYDKRTSKAIEKASASGYNKYYFVADKNKNAYEITFANMRQYNVQSGKQRSVRRVVVEPVCKGAGPDPKTWKGPVHARRTFESKLMDLWCVVGDSVAQEVRKSGRMMRASLGGFGAGLYFYSSPSMAKHMARERGVSCRGNIVSVKVFVGKELDMSYQEEKVHDFLTLQSMGYDCVGRARNEGKEVVVYNMDQVCVVDVSKYYG